MEHVLSRLFPLTIAMMLCTSGLVKGFVGWADHGSVAIRLFDRNALGEAGTCSAHMPLGADPADSLQAPAA